MDSRDLPSELATLVRRYGTHVLDDPDGLRATLDDFLDEGAATSGDINLLIDTVRFGALSRLTTLLDQGAEPAAAAAVAAEALAQQRGGDAQSAYWACTVLGYAAGLVPRGVISRTWTPPSAALASSSAPGAAGPPRPAEDPDPQKTNPAPGPGEPVPDDVPQPAGAGDQPPVARPGPREDDPAQNASGPRRSRAITAIAALATVVVTVAVAGIVYVAVTRGDDGGPVPVSAIADDFGHFGGNLTQGALDKCVDAALSDIPRYNCSFTGKPFELELTEQDPVVLNSRPDVLPDIVTSPPRDTIVSIQTTSDSNSEHAYYMTYLNAGADEVRNTGDDEVLLTLYDVDPDHAGAAIFSAENSDTDPLTQATANGLLRSIASSKDDAALFPILDPPPFDNSSLGTFVAMFLPDDRVKACVEAFTVIKDEDEQVACPDEAARDIETSEIAIGFGYAANASGSNRVARRYDGGRQYAWHSDDGDGRLFVDRLGRSTRLYWDVADGQVWGTLSSNTRGPSELMNDFRQFEGSPEIRPVPS